jgi:hypothetical protein
LQQERKEKSKQSKIFLDFSNTKPKIENKANQSYKATEANKEKQWKYFWSFCVLESRKIKMRNNKGKERKAWIYKGPTKYDM